MTTPETAQAAAQAGPRLRVPQFHFDSRVPLPAGTRVQPEIDDAGMVDVRGSEPPAPSKHVADTHLRAHATQR